MQTPGESVSLLTPIGYRNSSCGYCHSKSGSQCRKSLKREALTACFSYYASTALLQPEFYQSLINRGWRRSGCLLYKGNQRISCCPQYTIRLDSGFFHASKDQRQALNRFNKYILGELYIKEAARQYPKSRDQAKKRNTDFDLLERIHESEKVFVQTPPEPSHALSVTLESDNFTEEKFSLYENYQRIVHHEPSHRITRSGFKNFLCSSPIPRKTETLDGRERRLGSYHQCYRVDGKLIAIGVLDLLPQCVSAVYFMYHESVHLHNFGKIGALREIAWAKEEGYRWWYAGFYIHSCVKMRYKGDYSPQFILDPQSYSWHPLDDTMKKKLDANKFVSLSQGSDGEEIRKETTDGELMEDFEIDDDESDSKDDVGSDDSNDDSPIPDPDLSLFARSMPGVLTKEQLLKDVDLDRIKLRLQGEDVEAYDLVGWESSNIENPHSIKGAVADLVAAVGVKLGREMIVSFD